MNNHKKTQLLMQDSFEDTSETQVQFSGIIYSSERKCKT